MYFKFVIIYIKMFWKVVFIIVNDQNLSAACSHDVGLCTTQNRLEIADCGNEASLIRT
jgi:hypothetical protein